GVGGGDPGGQPLGGAEQILPAARILVGQGRREQGAQVREALGLDGAPQVLEQRRYRPLRVRRLDAGGGEARRDDDVLGLLRREPREVVIHAFDERVGAGQGRRGAGALWARRQRDDHGLGPVVDVRRVGPQRIDFAAGAAELVERDRVRGS